MYRQGLTVKSNESNDCNSNAVLNALRRTERHSLEVLKRPHACVFSRDFALPGKNSVHVALPIASKTKLETVRFLHRAMGL